MSVPSGLLDAGLAWLRRAAEQGWPPERARQRLDELRAAHPGLDVQLVWERESYGENTSYELLMTLPNLGTVSLSLSPEDGLPWGLRNAHSAPEGYVLRVNGRYMSVSTLMTSLDMVWGDAGLLQSLVDMLIIEGMVERLGLEPDEVSRAEAVAAFRREHRLEDDAHLERALAERGLSETELEDRLASAARRAALRARVLRDRLPEGWERTRRDLDQLRVARLSLATAEEAEALAAGLRRGEGSLAALAQARFLAGEVSAAEPLFAVLRRRDLSPRQDGLLFGQQPGTVVVVPSGARWELVQILAEISAEDAPGTREAAEGLLFDAWLAEQRRAAAITWYWGRWEPDQSA